MSEEVVRVPITGIQRVPILGVVSGEELQWDDIYSNLVNYIKYASKNVSEQYGGASISNSEDLFQEGQLVLYECYLKYKYKPMNQFSALFKASLWRHLRKLASKECTHQFDVVDIEDAYDLGYTDEVVDDIYQEYKLQQAAELLENSPVALTILKEFVNPSMRTLWEVRMDAARKQMLKSQGVSVAVPKTMSVRGIHIQRALEVSKTQFNREYKRVKSVVSQVFSNDEVEFQFAM